MNQSPHAALMINPLGFNPNPETAVDNAFQDAEIVDATERAAVAAEARVEVARIAEGLRGLGVEVLLIDDLPGSDVPDSVFPNNWISTHEDGRIVLYPMATPSRRRERRADVVEALRARYLVSDVIDLSAMEQDALYLEGTGALVLDHVNRVAYVARSGRAHTAAALRWCSAMEYDAEIFDTVDAHGAPIYHTNVVLSIGSEFVTAGLENIPDPTERARVLARLTASGREVVALDPAQVAEFAGNGLELVGADGRRVFALSARAAAALRTDQRAQIERFAHVFPISIPTIERSGGSVRCTLAGIHLPPRGAARG
ncbi:MAG: citrulline utilization hydrolase CtlX [Candidatus Limnocylindrus sp.]